MNSSPVTLRPAGPRASIGSPQKIAIVLCLILFESLLIAPQLKHNDFDQYWAGARLLLHHRNPYNPAALYALEQSAGSTAPRVVMLMIPPWTLPLIAPLGLLPYGAARVLWFALGLLLVISATEILWRSYGVRDAPEWLPLVLALTFVPNLSAIIDGQILPVVLFLLAAFLALTQTRRDVLIGLSLLGLGIKPHLTYLVALAAAMWIVDERRWTALAACLSVFAVSCASVWFAAPEAFAGYRAAGAETAIVVSGFGGLLRSIFGMRHYWLQFTPLIPGLLWFGWYRKRLRDWNWREHLPILLLASVVTSAYGWWYDQALLTVALVPGVVLWRKADQGRKRRLLFAYLAVAAMQAATPMFSLDLRFYLWTAPALALVYFACSRAPISNEGAARSTAVMVES